MKLLILSQVFWPDTASTAQHLSDFADEMEKNGHEVRVICSRFAYESPQTSYSRYEHKNTIEIKRLRNTKFGKGKILGRLVDFLSYNALLVVHLFKIRKHKIDAILGMTSPPLVSFIAVRFAKIKKVPFIYWTMDLQPELAIASKMIRKNSPSALLLTRLGAHIIKHSALIFSLDRYMADYLVKKGSKSTRIATIPVWSVVDKRYMGEIEDNPYRINNGFTDKVVVMYSGNHAHVHPLDTLLKAAAMLKDDSRFVFAFVGGGVRKKDVTQFKKENSLTNVVQLPYEPRENIHHSLGAADIHVVVLGENQVGFTHPNKIYGAMFLAKPIAYIGPSVSHVNDILRHIDGNISIEHDEQHTLVKQLKAFAELRAEDRQAIGNANLAYASEHFNPVHLKSNMVHAVENCVEPKQTFKDKTIPKPIPEKAILF